MEFIKNKINYYFYNNKKDESSYIFDIQSEEEIKTIKRVGFGTTQELIVSDLQFNEFDSVYDYKYILTLFVSILLLSVKILYTKLIYK